MAGQRYKFRNAGEARDYADQLEQVRDDEVQHLREQGQDAAAERLADKYDRELAEVRGIARTLDEQTARNTKQPKDTPAEKPSRRSPRRVASGSRSTRDSSAGGSRRVRPSRSSSGGSGGRSPVQRVVQRGYSRSGAQAQVTSWSTLLWQLAGLTIGIALLTLFISSSRGTSAFAGLTGGLANGLGLIVDPIDPLATGSLKSTIEKPATSPPPTTASGRVLKTTVTV